MFNVLDSSNLGKEYKGFILLSIEDLPDYKARGVFLRHKKTGLEVFHIINDDKENLFAFGFRTLAKDSKGTAHIMEHSTLCGTEKFPLKEPFATLAATSVNTFMNAFTYPDKTVYPASSLIRSDYFTMMDVYADCVFFPKLEHGTFLQEGHRLEMDENGKCSVQGVVYNEMKGNFSSFHPIAYGNITEKMFPDSYPAFSSGGDPIEIPELTYQEFLDFHQKFYNPDNCLLFLYGNIPTADQLDFLAENYMPRIEAKYGVKDDSYDYMSKETIMKPEIVELQKLKMLDKSQEFHTIAPQTGATGSFVTMNWYSGTCDMEKYYLSEVLFGNDSSPIDYALKESGLGDEVSTGNFGQYRQEFFCIGLHGVKKGNEQKVYDLIESEIKKVYEEGVSQEDIDSAIMGIDFNLREVNRYWGWGPYALTIMEKVMKGWQWGLPCSNQLTPITSFEKVKKEIAADPEYTRKLIKKYFIDQKVCIKIVVEPSEKYFEERTKAENETIARLEKAADKIQLKKDLDELHEYQARVETPEETACIKTTKKSDLDPKIEYPETKLQFVKGADGSDVPLFVSQEETNGIFYVDVLFPFDNIDPKYYEYIPFLSGIMTNLGWNNKSWDECISEISCVTGDVWGRMCVGTVTNVPICVEYADQFKQYNFNGRKWLGIACKSLTSQSEETFRLLAEIITKMNFTDEKRFTSLAQDNLAEKKSGLVSAGRDYALKRAKATMNIMDALYEIFWGISQLYTAKDLTTKPAAESLKIFEKIYFDSLKCGGIIHITADEESLKKILPEMENFAKSANITKLLPAPELKLEDFIPFIRQSEITKDDKAQQVIKIDTQTAYSVAVTKSADYLTKEAAAETVLNSWLGMHSLWDKIRTTGGAYGAGVWSDNPSNTMCFHSYRDPSPDKSIEAYKSALKEVIENPIPAEDIEKTIVSCYGDAIVPVCPKDRGNRGFEGMIFGNPQSLRQLRVDQILALKPEDITDAAKRIYENMNNLYKTAIFCDNSKKYGGNIVNIPI